MVVNDGSRVRGALLALACGDALGAPVEFTDAPSIRARHGTLRDMVGGGGFGWAPGEWTDDTGMTLAVAEGILESPDDPVEAVGRRFLEWRRTAKDVGSTIAAALSAYRGNWTAASSRTPQAREGKAAGNGSLMRTLPMALRYADDEMLRVSARSSAMTHWDPQAEVCCAVYCLWIRQLLAGGEIAASWQVAVEAGERAAERGRLPGDTPGPSPLPADFWPRLQRIPDLNARNLQPTGYAGYVVECLEAAVWHCVHADSLEETLVGCVNLGGETDTIAAVAGGAAGTYWGVEAIPARWLDVLHERERIESVANELCRSGGV
jgi:ADP-ribosyl-[dinitrogen reductase] hydrolase